MKENVFKSAAIALVIALGWGSAEALASGFQHRGHGLHGRNGFVQGHKSHRFFDSHPRFHQHRGFDSRDFRGFQSRRFLKRFHRGHHRSLQPGFEHKRFGHGFRHRPFDHGFHHPGFHGRSFHFRIN